MPHAAPLQVAVPGQRSTRDDALTMIEDVTSDGDDETAFCLTFTVSPAARNSATTADEARAARAYRLAG